MALKEKSFNHATDGLDYAINHERNLKIEIFIGILVCVAGFIFKLFAYFAKKTDSTKKKKVLFATGIIIATIIIPVINTGLFIAGATLFFLNSVYGGSAMAVINGVFTILYDILL